MWQEMLLNTRPSSTFRGWSGNEQILCDLTPPSPYPMQMHFDVGTFDISSWTYAAGHHWTDWTSLPLSHDLPTRLPTTTWQHATSCAPVECQMSITFLIPLQPPSCFLQPWSQCLLWPREDGRWSDPILIDPEWGHWNQPRTCWWVSGLYSMVLNKKFRFQFISSVNGRYIHEIPSTIITTDLHWVVSQASAFYSAPPNAFSISLIPRPGNETISVFTPKDWSWPSHIKVSILKSH